MPALSPTMTTGSIASWAVKQGDKVSAGTSLAEIETDKAVLSLDSPEEGYIAKLLRKAGDKDLPVGEVICIIVENKADVPAFAAFTADSAGAGAAPAAGAAAAPAAAAAAAPAAASATAAPMATGSAGGRVIASPLAKKTAAEQGVSLAGISGTGPNSRIINVDVLAAAASGARVAAPAAHAAAAPTPAAAPTGGYTDIPNTQMRKVIAERLTASKQSIPHFYVTVHVELDKLLALRAQLNKATEKDGVKLSVNDFIVKASALALRKVPEANSAWQGSFIRQFHSADVCVAVDTGAGLITPIVPAAETLGLAAISAKVKDLAARAKSSKLLPHEYQGGTFTISNLGMFGVDSFTAIINPPQACILAVGAGAEVIVPDESAPGGVRKAMRMSVSLSCDHRVVDGAVGARWLQAFKGYIEKPVTMML